MSSPMNKHKLITSSNGTTSLLQLESDLEHPLRRPLSIIDNHSHFQNTSQHSPPQQIAFNINHRSTRLTFWSIVILIVSVAETNFILSMRLYYQTYKKQFDPSVDPNPYSGTRALDYVSIASNIFLLIASSFILLGLHKSTTNRIIPCVMFIIGSALHLTPCIWGMRLYCIDDPTKPSINNDNAFCRLSFMGSDLYLQAFLIFYCLDILKSYGDNIRARVFIHSMLLSAVGFMNAGNTFHDDETFSKDTALIFASTVVATGYLIIAL
eukprot:243457_1